MAESHGFAPGLGTKEPPTKDVSIATRPAAAPPSAAPPPKNRGSSGNGRRHTEGNLTVKERGFRRRVQKAVLERERHKLEMFRRVIDVGLVLVTFGAILIVVFTTMGRATRWGWRSGNGTFLDLEPLLDESVSLYLVCFLGATTVGAGILTISTIPTDSADLDVLLGSATRGRLLTGGVFVALAGLKMFEEAPALYPRTGGAWGLNFIHPTAFILWVV